MGGSTRRGRSVGPWMATGLLIASGAGVASGQATMPGPATAPAVSTATAPAPAQGLPDEVQIVRFTLPEGVRIHTVAPQPDPVPIGDGRGALTVGLRVGTSYRFRLSNLPGQPPDEAIYPIVEMVGHLHRPAAIDPSRFPIRVVIREEDLDDVLLRSRMVTQVVYLEDPELAVPLAMNRDDIPTADLSASEDPLRVAAALGRVMAIVRIGGRTPANDELALPPGMAPLPASPCPFGTTRGGPCDVPLGPTCGTPPPRDRAWMPKDEYLCDGGDHAKPAHFGGNGGLRGIDPRDAVVRFSRPDREQLEPVFARLRDQFERGEITANAYGIALQKLGQSTQGDLRPRVLPTNIVCLYAPRFASVRTTLGPNEALNIQALRKDELLQRQEQALAKQESVKLAQLQSPVIGRHRARPSAAINKVALITNAEVRILQAIDTPTRLGQFDLLQVVDVTKGRQGPGKIRTAESAVAIKTSEGVVVHARTEGLGEKVMSWKPQETAGVETPPNQPGLAVVKRVDVSSAEPGDTVNYTIHYRNMGNVPLSDVAIVDSLLPRFEYTTGTAQGPKGTVFTANENQAGAMELRWDLPGIIEPGAEGSVSFSVTIR